MEVQVQMIGDENTHLSTGKLLYPKHKNFSQSKPYNYNLSQINQSKRGTLAFTKNRNTEKKKEKYRYAVSKIDEIPILHLRSVTLTLSCIHLACLFFLRRGYTRNQPQQSPRENVRPLIDRHNDRKVRSLDVLPISSQINRQKLFNHAFIVKSKVFQY